METIWRFPEIFGSLSWDFNGGHGDCPNFRRWKTRLKSLLGQKQVLPSLINTHGDSPKVDSMENWIEYIYWYIGQPKKTFHPNHILNWNVLTYETHNHNTYENWDEIWTTSKKNVGISFIQWTCSCSFGISLSGGPPIGSRFTAIWKLSGCLYWIELLRKKITTESARKNSSPSSAVKHVAFGEATVIEVCLLFDPSWFKCASSPSLPLHDSSFESQVQYRLGWPWHVINVSDWFTHLWGCSRLWKYKHCKKNHLLPPLRPPHSSQSWFGTSSRCVFFCLMVFMFLVTLQ